MKRTRKSDAGEKVFMALNLPSALMNVPESHSLHFGRGLMPSSFVVFVLQKDTKPPVQTNGKDTENTDHLPERGEFKCCLNAS